MTTQMAGSQFLKQSDPIDQWQQSCISGDDKVSMLFFVK
jgi:hypothetical protein